MKDILKKVRFILSFLSIVVIFICISQNVSAYNSCPSGSTCSSGQWTNDCHTPYVAGQCSATWGTEDSVGQCIDDSDGVTVRGTNCLAATKACCAGALQNPGNPSCACNNTCDSACAANNNGWQFSGACKTGTGTCSGGGPPASTCKYCVDSPVYTCQPYYSGDLGSGGGYCTLESECNGAGISCTNSTAPGNPLGACNAACAPPSPTPTSAPNPTAGPLSCGSGLNANQHSCNFGGLCRSCDTNGVLQTDYTGCDYSTCWCADHPGDSACNGSGTLKSCGAACNPNAPNDDGCPNACNGSTRTCQCAAECTVDPNTCNRFEVGTESNPVWKGGVNGDSGVLVPSIAVSASQGYYVRAGQSSCPGQGSTRWTKVFSYRNTNLSSPGQFTGLCSGDAGNSTNCNQLKVNVSDYFSQTVATRTTIGQPGDYIIRSQITDERGDSPVCYLRVLVGVTPTPTNTPTPTPYPTIAVKGVYREDLSTTANSCTGGPITIASGGLALSVSTATGITGTCSIKTNTNYECNITVPRTGTASQTVNISASYSGGEYSPVSWRASNSCSGVNTTSVAVNLTNGTNVQPLDLFFQYATSWFKLANTSFVSRGNANNYIPSTISAYDSSTDGSGSANDTGNRYVIDGANPGLFTYGTSSTINLGTGASYSSPNFYNSYNTTQNLTPSKFLDYVKARRNYKAITNVSEITGNGVYVYTGATLSLTPTEFSSWNVVLIAPSTAVTIDVPFTPTNNVAVIASSITFGANINAAKGIFIGSNVTILDATNNLGLKIDGNLISQNTITNSRTVSDNAKPGLFVTFNPGIYASLLEYLSINSYEWKQLQ